MAHFSKTDLAELDKIFRINLVNSVTGIKPANLIGTISENNIANLAIFSSVVHLGSNPALVGFVQRPTDDVRRDTFDNIMANQVYTINHVAASCISQAHQTSAKYASDVSEFEACGLTEEYFPDWPAPFVAQSQVKMAVRLLESVPIQWNGTVLMIGAIEHIVVDDSVLEDDGHIDPSLAASVGVSGLNTYYRLSRSTKLEYAKPV